jgi:hypothetical protein
MTDEKAIEIARGYVYGYSEIFIPDDDITNPNGIIVVNFLTKPPTVTRIKDVYPNLRVPKE